MTEAESGNIGPPLRQRRQELNLSLDEVARKTKIRKTYIAAIEDEKFDELPGKIYVVGFLQNYARVLGIAPEPLVGSFQERSGTGAGSVPPRPQMRSAALTAGRRSSSRWVLWLLLAGLALALMVFFIPGWLDSFSRSGEPSAPATKSAGDHSTASEEPPAPAHQDRDLSLPNVAGEASPSADTAPAAEVVDAMPVLPAGGGTLKMVTAGEGRFLIAIDGQEPREYVAQPGLTLSWDIRERAAIDLGVEGQVRLIIDEREHVVAGQGQLLLTPPATRKE